MRTHDIYWGNKINLCFSENSILHTAHVETIYIFPVAHLFLIEPFIFKCRHKNLCLIWPNGPAFFEVFVSDGDNRVKHALIEKKVSHPFGDYDVNTAILDLLDILDLSFNDLNLVAVSGLIDDIFSEISDISIVNGVDFLCLAILDSKKTEDAGTCSYIKDCLPLKQVDVSLDRTFIGIGSGFIFKHFLMNVKVRIASKVIILIAVERQLGTEIL